MNYKLVRKLASEISFEKKIHKENYRAFNITFVCDIFLENINKDQNTKQQNINLVEESTIIC